MVMAGACGMHRVFIAAILLLSCNIVAMAGPWAGSAITPEGRYHGGAGWGYYGEDMVEEAATRRVLGDTSTYISYSALTADAVPCSTAGTSYYNCDSSGAVNPYTRSCTTITLCARDTS